jgi:hypothetical protein
MSEQGKFVLLFSTVRVRRIHYFLSLKFLHDLHELDSMLL